MSNHRPILEAAAPILLVRDIVAMAAHFRTCLGFSGDDYFGDPPSFIILGRDQQFIMLRQADNPADVRPHHSVAEYLWDAYFWVRGADALHDEFVANGATIDYAPCDQPYGVREFGIRTPDGHDIGFGDVVEGA